MSLEESTRLRMQIDHREAEFLDGMSVLRAAELNGVKIPSLCSHKDLSPFGSCRMCMVEIAGFRGYPLACDTRATAGMQVLTDTVRLRELRTEILRLILSEHPSSCFVCDEAERCAANQSTVRKAGVSTGCRYCPNDRQCELQDLVDELGVKEIGYPIYYHGYEPEQDDPFYDRDYNICILCGRCVRMCQEVRGTAVLAFTWRGRQARISPAFGRSHVAAGCEFCGACVDVCPTGALAEKVAKWDGRPDGFTRSTCPFCAVGCQIELAHKSGRLSSAKASPDPEVNDGQLCVKGRFCLPETTHHHSRAKKPMVRKGRYFRVVPWEEALAAAADALGRAAAEKVLLLVSPDISCEGLFAAREFAVRAMPGAHLDTSARDLLPGGANAWKALFAHAISMSRVGKSDTILTVGLDTRFHFSIAGVQVRRALSRGARLIAVDAREGNLCAYTDHCLRPIPGAEGTLLAAFADALEGNAPNVEMAAAAAHVVHDDLAAALEIVASGEDVAVLVGPQAIGSGGTDALAALLRISNVSRVMLVPLYFGANTRAALEFGLLDGDAPALGWSAIRAGSAAPEVLYLAGENPLFRRPECGFLIVQDMYAPAYDVDVFLPAASFVETAGSLVNIEGRLQNVPQVETFPEGSINGFSRPDWWIFSRLAQQLGAKSPRFESRQEVLAGIAAEIAGFPANPDRSSRVMAGARREREALNPVTTAIPVACNPPVSPYASPSGRCDSESWFVLVPAPAGFRHRGIDLTAKVEGLGMLGLEDGFRMHPADLERIGVTPNGRITVTVIDGPTATDRVHADEDCPRGAIYFTLPTAVGGLGARPALGPLYGIGHRPVPASVIADRGTTDDPVAGQDA